VATFNSKEMALRGRIGGFARAARLPREQLTSAARNGFLARFELEVDPGKQLAPEERRRRAEAARRAYMARLALVSAKKRRNKTLNLMKKATVAAVAEEARDAGATST
jgi:hypothetical protein